MRKEAGGFLGSRSTNDDFVLEIPPLFAPRDMADWSQERVAALEGFEDKHRKLARAAESLTRELSGRRCTSMKYAEAAACGMEELRYNRFVLAEASNFTDCTARRFFVCPSPMERGPRLFAGAR